REVLLAEDGSTPPTRADIEDWAARLRCLALHVHSSGDRVVPLRVGEDLAELTGGRLVVLEGTGHVPAAGDPVRCNALIHEFAEGLRPQRPVREACTRWNHRPRRVLHVSSAIAPGHARRAPPSLHEPP